MRLPHFLVFEKLRITLKNLKRTAYHHYGENYYSIPKFIYYSIFSVNTFILFGTELTDDLPIIPIDDELIIIKPDSDQLEKIREGKDLPREFYYDRIHGVKNCYLTLKGNDIAHVYWVYFKGDYNRFLKLDDEVAELNYNTALPDYRGRGLMGKMISYIHMDLRNNGVKKVVGVINEKNPPAIKSVTKAGWKEIRRIKTIGPFNFKVKVGI
jgi:hypothetical protein